VTDKETFLLVGAGFFAWMILRRPRTPATGTQLTAQQLAAQQLAATQQAAMPAANNYAGAGQLAAGIGQGLGSLLQGIGSLTGAGSGTNRENGGNYSYESTAVVDEYDAMPEYYYESSEAWD
jgi:hypothetical protein